MAIINCPHCRGKLRFPDDLPPRKVKCPACSNSFLAGPNGPIDEEEVPPPKPKKPELSKPVAKKPSPVRPLPQKPAPTVPPKKRVEEDFDVLDEKPARARSRDEDDDGGARSKGRDSDDEDDNRDRKRRSRDDEGDDKPRSRHRDDDVDEDRPRSKRRDEDEDRPRKRRDRDDDDDRPRSRRRDEYDDDEDRPRSKQRGRYDDDGDDDDRPRSKRRARDDDDRPRAKDNLAHWRNARQGFNLVGIGLWCQVGALGVLVFHTFLFSICGEYVEELTIPAGIAGIANWILAVIGLSFFIAGSKKGNLLGLTIAALVIAGLHLALVVYLSFHTENAMTFGLRGGGGIRWDAVPTQLPELVIMLIFSHFVTIPFIAALLEIARFVLYCLVLKEYGRVCKDRGTSGAGMMQLIMLPSMLAISLLLFLILKMIYKNAGGGGSEGKYIFFLMFLIQFGGYIFVYVMSALSAAKAKDAILSRPR